MSDARARAANAKRELGETEEAFRAVRDAMTAALFATATTQVLEREKLYLGVQSLDAVQAALMRVIDTGRLEEAEEELRARRMTPRDPTRMPFSQAA